MNDACAIQTVLLRLGSEGRGEQARHNSLKKLPPIHYSITWSAHASSDGGIVRPRVLAA